MEWRPVKNYEGLYEVNENGEIKALKREWYSGVEFKIFRIKESHFLKPTLKKTGYCHVTLLKEGKQKTKSVHRIVAEAFIKNDKNKQQVNHINGNKSDNRLSNLEWATPTENTIHAYENELLISKKRGEHSQAKKIKCTTLDMEFDCINNAADVLGVKKYSIGKICNGRQRQTAGLTFKFI